METLQQLWSYFTMDSAEGGKGVSFRASIHKILNTFLS